MSVSEAACRAAFRLVALNVAIITSSDGEQAHGCTATAWVEDPRSPYLATALKRAGGTRAAIAGSGRLAASILGEDQIDIARQFARSGERFAGVAHHIGPLGQPLIDGALVAMECTVVNSIDFGTYDLLVAQIEGLEITSRASPLAFWKGSFSSVRPLSSHHD
jgi:flavin reductase